MSPSRLLSDEEFHQFTQVNVDDEIAQDLELENKVLQDDMFLNTLSAIKQGIFDAFKVAQAYAQSFEQYKVMYLEDMYAFSCFYIFYFRTTNIEEYRGTDAATFSSLITRFKHEISEMEKIPLTADIGILQVNSSALKEMLIPAPKRCLSQIEKLLPDVANNKTNELVSLLKSSNEKISAIPSTVEQFVDFMAFLRKLNDDQVSLEDQFQVFKYFSIEYSSGNNRFI